MRIGYTPGCWDVFHSGHALFLRNAAQLCDGLVVGVASDSVIEIDKGQKPACTLSDRMIVLQAIRWVAVAAPYYRLEFITHLQLFRPDVLFVGQDWGHQQRHIDAETYMANKQVIKLPYTQGISSSQLRSYI